MAYFEIMGEPQGKGRPRFSQTGTYTNVRTPEKTVIYENLVQLEYIRQCKKFRFPEDKPLRMKVEAFYAIPKNASKKKRIAMMSGAIKPTKKPDVDNVLKIIADSLNQVAYHDDAQIAQAIVSKFYSDIPKVCITIEEMEDTPS